MNQKTDENLADLIPWDELIQILQKENIKELARNIDVSSIKFAADQKNREQVIESAWKSLKSSDPDNASYERAVQLADKMRDFAKMIIDNTDLKNKKS